MKIVFENHNEDFDFDSNISIEVLNDNITSVKTNNIFEDQDRVEYTNYHFSKKQLSEFIGSLLHIQSKLNNRK